VFDAGWLSGEAEETRRCLSALFRRLSALETGKL
jgi:hypothetical protein